MLVAEMDLKAEENMVAALHELGREYRVGLKGERESYS
jgi:bifunctional pyridoxal-dependent enzyme with beta-cystathionase and maltose regulon repressor activities